ncbi:hypothetical protein Tco_0826705, partial [Tanacetum coccineum]
EITPTGLVASIHSGYDDGTQSIPNDNHHSIHPSPHESADKFVHNYDDIDGGLNVEEGESSRSNGIYVPKKLVATRQDLEYTVRLYTDMSKCYKDLKEVHSSYGVKIEMLTKEKDQLKLYPVYDKLFEKEYPFVMKIASGYRHTVADLLKIHPDPAPSESLVAPTISSALVVASSNKEKA